MEDSFVRKITIWAALATILAALATIAGFSIFEKIYIFHGGGNVSGLRVSAGSNDISSPADHDDSTKQACDKLAKEAADDVTQGFLLSAERTQSMRLNLRCNQRGRP